MKLRNLSIIIVKRSIKYIVNEIHKNMHIINTCLLKVTCIADVQYPHQIPVEILSTSRYQWINNFELLVFLHFCLLNGQRFLETCRPFIKRS